MAIEFTCPKCGCHYWATHQKAAYDGGDLGFCKGPMVPLKTVIQSGARFPLCGFIWPRSEDSKYFREITMEEHMASYREAKGGE